MRGRGAEKRPRVPRDFSKNTEKKGIFFFYKFPQANTGAQTFRTLSQGLPNVPNLSFGAVDLTAAEVTYCYYFNAKICLSEGLLSLNR
jgi:hypothetical protein